MPGACEGVQSLSLLAAQPAWPRHGREIIGELAVGGGHGRTLPAHAGSRPGRMARMLKLAVLVDELLALPLTGVGARVLRRA